MITRAERVLLCILDGVGEAAPSADNAVTSAAMPTLSRLKRTHRWLQLVASGPAVGLPEGQIGNSEVGHLTIGAGRAVPQDLPRIDALIRSGELFTTKAIQRISEHLRAHPHARLHLLGIVSDGGVHGHWRHIHALADHFLRAGCRVCLHAFTDGRDTLPGSGKTILERLTAQLPDLEIVSLVGRFFAMDRDHNHERTQAAAQLLLAGKADSRFTSVTEAIADAYDHGQTDEFITPRRCHHATAPFAGIADTDVVLHTNFRADRARQLMQAICHARKQALLVTLTPYSDALTAQTLTVLPAKTVRHTLGQLLADRGMGQTRIAETEKYAHVTYFFNGGREDPFPGEKRVLIPSLKCQTYAQVPEMSAPQIAQAIIHALQEPQQRLIVANFANGDMVGHSGDFTASVQALEAVDQCLQDILQVAHDHQVATLITADHGNAEQMRDPVSGKPHTAHTLNPVPFIAVGQDCRKTTAPSPQWSLADIAPTILDLLAVEPPDDFMGRSLLGT